MAKNGFVIVSHSKKIGDGIVDLISEMVTSDEKVTLRSASGTEDGRIGTSATLILEAFNEMDDHQHIFVFYDIGSSKMSAEMAIELFDEDYVQLVDAPIVEGAFAGAVTASVIEDTATILAEIANANNPK
ncbi:MAG: PTS-dependent dihydroxyacetone kinase phosphotransferase subunit DhaM [Erysipelothrix sp.]|nr:PTS-dependent dihydroxyacetone kinase phosphotransferase subunit DhaM [Erysipelothrix sp.]